MGDILEKISDSELEVMKVLWAADEALPLSDIRTTLQKAMDWEAATIKTLLSRLVKKRAVKQEKREVFYYSALVGEKEYNEWAAGQLIKKLYHGKARNLIAALVNSDELTDTDIEELRDLLNRE